MDVGTVNDWSLDRVVTASGIADRIGERWPFEPVDRAQPSDVAERFRYLDDNVEFGVIPSISRPFCGDCARAPPLLRRPPLHLPLRRHRPLAPRPPPRRRHRRRPARLPRRPLAPA